MHENDPTWLKGSNSVFLTHELLDECKVSRFDDGVAKCPLVCIINPRIVSEMWIRQILYLLANQSESGK